MHINVLELPEIAQVIAGYLSHLNDLKPCLTVCKTWRSLYLPYFWYEAETGHLPERPDRPPFLDPTRHGQYLQFVQVLTVYTDFGSIHQSLDYPSLRQLSLRCSKDEIWSSPDDENPVLRDFVNRHLLLEWLDLHYIPSSITDSVWTALVDHPRLENLSLVSNYSVPHIVVPDDFWRVCARLKTLMFSGAVPWCIPKGLVLSSIRQLNVTVLYNRNTLDIIAACPLLEDLRFVGLGSRDRAKWVKFAQLATQGAWPHLRQLPTEFDADDTDLSQIIASMHQATKIEIDTVSFGPLSIAALQRHASTLEYLGFPIAMSSRMVRDVLCTFPRLKHLEAHRLDAKDIVEGGPWVCTSLRKLSVGISFSNGEDNLQPAVFERMSRLVHLEEFDSRYRTEGEHGLIFRLQSGMSALANLTRLRYVELDSAVQAMDSDDARWIIDHWKSLEEIQGWVSRDRSMREQLGDLFSTREILLSTY